MAESPPRSDAPDSASGGDLNAPRVVENGDAPERVAAAPAPWGGSRPWWSAESGDGTGPHRMPGHGYGTGPHGVVPDGTGPHGVLPGGSGAHRIVPGGGSGAHPVIRDGTGPLPAVPGQAPPGPPPPARKKRLPRFLLVAGTTVVAAGVLMVGVLAFRMDEGGAGAKKDARTTGVPASKKVIDAGPNAGGLHKDPLTPPQTSAAYPFVAGAVEAGGIPAAERGQAVYSEEPVQPVNVLFVGGTGPVGDPGAFLQKARPSTFIAGQDADAGPKGGKAVCGTFAVLAETHTFCAWATRDSYGIVASNQAAPGAQFALMSDVMRRIRNDVEKPK
ncbi:hypothetical protein [Actinomadura sp. 7K507]|uniref:hypothetical protein n=1 Tax=Actinomadura sp. 7K507 TaxID=2530365 RepID=UPI0010490138|nr:hypothetical protein [Actinomadura sp. 7K507]TDC89685.1 hypothetical protein E1285_16085 [Actinomadura sp. 7K507]